MEPKQKQLFFVYLGGHHKKDGGWRRKFNQLAAKLTEGLGFYIIGVDPFRRKIDEANPWAVVGRDLAVIYDERLTHLVFEGSDLGAVLSDGAACEKTIGWFLGKPVIIIGEPEKGKTYSSGTYFNKWYHPFGEVLSDVIVADVEAAILWIIADIQNPKLRKLGKEKLADLCQQYRFGRNGDFDPFAV